MELVQIKEKQELFYSIRIYKEGNQSKNQLFNSSSLKMKDNFGPWNTLIEILKNGGRIGKESHHILHLPTQINRINEKLFDVLGFPERKSIKCFGIFNGKERDLKTKTKEAEDVFYKITFEVQINQKPRETSFFADPTKS
jgi:hypothetical protein